MRKTNILKIVAATVTAFGLGAVAHAGTFTARMQAELNSGKDHSAASAAASHATGPLHASELAPDAGQARAALDQGRDYVSRRDASSRAVVASPERSASAKRIAAALNEGKDYAAAWNTNRTE